jgi:hypothetical protein
VVPSTTLVSLEDLYALPVYEYRVVSSRDVVRLADGSRVIVRLVRQVGRQSRLTRHAELRPERQGHGPKSLDVAFWWLGMRYGI